ncbi:MAG: hypothetical protein WCD76_10570, partial [Pyrinomonadaceae bacterium]
MSYRHPSRQPSTRARRMLTSVLSLMLAFSVLPAAHAQMQSVSGDSGASRHKSGRAEFVPGDVLVRFREGAAALATGAK